MNNINNNCIDCIFDINNKNIVLIKRKHEPYEGYWALPGGRQEENELLDDTVIREMKEETGVTITKLSDNIPLKVNVCNQVTVLNQVRSYFSGKDPRKGNTAVYSIQLKGDIAELNNYFTAGSDAKDLKIFKLNSLPENIAFDHYRFIEDYFLRLKSYDYPIPAVDLIIEYENSGKYVYVERGGIPKGKALPGGFAKSNMAYEQSAIEEAKEETGLDIKIVGLLGTYSNPDRDPRRHIASTVFLAKGYGKLNFGDDAIGGGLFTLDNVPNFVFDHNSIVNDYKKLMG